MYCTKRYFLKCLFSRAVAEINRDAQQGYKADISELKFLQLQSFADLPMHENASDGLYFLGVIQPLVA